MRFRVPDFSRLERDAGLEEESIRAASGSEELRLREPPSAALPLEVHGFAHDALGDVRRVLARVLEERPGAVALALTMRGDEDRLGP
jgi:hypothetical protein